MTYKALSKIGKVACSGLVGIVACSNINAAVIGINNEFNGDQSVSRPNYVYMENINGTNGIDSGLDAPYPYGFYDNEPVIDFFEQTSFSSPYDRLMQGGRGLDNLSTVPLKISGRNLPGPTQTNLSFSTLDTTGLDNKDIYLSLRNLNTNDTGIYNIKDFAASGKSLSLLVDNGDCYTADLMFSTLGTPKSIGDFSGNSLYIGANTNVTANNIISTDTISVIGNLTASSITADTLNIGTDNGFANTVPEPSTLASLLLAGMGLVGAYKYLPKK